MEKFTCLILFVIIPHATLAQVSPERCKVFTAEGADQFEQWIFVKKETTTRKNTKGKFRIPIVIHILHDGESVGEGFNFSKERIESQIRSLNEDFNRREGTNGFNTHPDGASAEIEFVLAEKDPEGNPTEGITRTNILEVEVEPAPGNLILTGSRYIYWDPEKYINIWTMDLGIPHGLFLGLAQFPLADIEGLPRELPQGYADGIFINAPNFGQGPTHIDPNFNLGRTLTHEMGHFLGLLHTWGASSINNACGQTTDYCNDTPPVTGPTNGCPTEKPLACDERPAMSENYMDWSNDRCMNIFTKDQVARMRTVMENSPMRKTLVTSDVIDRPTSIADHSALSFVIYPNPARDKKLQLSCANSIALRISVRNLLGQILLEKSLEPKSSIELDLTHVSDNLVVVTAESTQGVSSRLVLLQ